MTFVYIVGCLSCQQCRPLKSAQRDHLASTCSFHKETETQRGKIYLPKVIYQVIAGQELVSTYFPVFFLWLLDHVIGATNICFILLINFITLVTQFSSPLWDPNQGISSMLKMLLMLPDTQLSCLRILTAPKAWLQGMWIII